jgi:phenylalanyl-tRNA synthetase beta chain
LRIANAKACPAYSGVLIEGVKVGPSPDWLKHRLAAAGMRSINNVVDVTNLILLEWGQPLHAFDWDRLLQVMGKEEPTIEVRFAQPGETLKTLDGQIRTLHAENHLIVAGSRPVALAGVMGGEETEVDEATTKVFLEAALFDPVVTRRSSRLQGLRTEASARYERGVNLATLELARDRAVQLILELAGGAVVGLTTFDQRPPLERTLQLRLSRLIDVLGDEVQPEEVEEILSALGFQLSRSQAVAPKADPATATASVASCVWQVSVPPHRLRDVEREIDLIEEFARLYGYNRFSETLPTEPLVGSPLDTGNFDAANSRGDAGHWPDGGVPHLPLSSGRGQLPGQNRQSAFPRVLRCAQGAAAWLGGGLPLQLGPGEWPPAGF